MFQDRPQPSATRVSSRARAVTLARRTLTVLPARDGIHFAHHDQEQADVITIHSFFMMTEADWAEMQRWGLNPAKTPVPLRISVSSRLARNIPCAREPLRIDMTLEALWQHDALTMHARAQSLYPAAVFLLPLLSLPHAAHGMGI